MYTKNKQAFTMLELTFVIVIIGILSAIAIPRFADTADSAYMVKAQSTITTVRSALATERQKRILRGDYKVIGDLGDATNVFNLMEADRDGNQASLFQYPIVNCAVGQTACWDRVDATHYSFKFPDSADGQANFILQRNRLDCVAGAANEAKCALITR